MDHEATGRRQLLRECLAAPGPTVVPGAYDAISARLIEVAGFDAAYVGSYATAASRLGLPDVGMISLDAMVDHAASIADAVQVPVLADAENGFVDAASIWRTVRLFEKAGVAGIHLEDHRFGKHAPVPQVLDPLDTALGRLRAALDARTDPAFLIIARTDAVFAHQDIEEAVARMQAYIDAGADMVFPSGVTPDQLAAVRARIGGPVVITDQRGYTVADEAAAGADMVLYYGFTLYAAHQGVERALRELRKSGDGDAGPGVRAQIESVEDMMGYDDFAARVRKYSNPSS